MGDYTVKVGVDLGDGLAQLQKAESMVNKMASKSQKIKMGVDFDKSGLSQLRSLESLAKRNYTTKLRVDVGSTASAISRIKNQADSLKKTLSHVSAPKITGSSNIGKVTEDLRKLKTLQTELNSKSLKLTKMGDAKSQTNEYKALQQSIKSINQEMSKFNSVSQKSFQSSSKSGMAKFNRDMAEATAKTKDYSSAARQAASANSLIMKGNTSSNRMLNWLKNNTKAVKQYGEAIEQVASQAKSAGLNGDALGLSDANTKFREITSEAQLMGKTGNSIFSELGRGFKQIGQFVGVYAILHKGAQTIGQMVGEVKNLDSALVSLKKVTDESDRSYANFIKNGAKTAKSMGSSVSDYVTQSSEWAKLG